MNNIVSGVGYEKNKYLWIFKIMINDRELWIVWFIVSVALSFYFYNKKQNKKNTHVHMKVVYVILFLQYNRNGSYRI